MKGDDKVKDKIMLFIIGVLTGAVLATGAFYAYNKINNSNNNQTSMNGKTPPSMPNGQPPEIPSGENNKGGQPPQMPNSNNSQNNTETNNN